MTLASHSEHEAIIDIDGQSNIEVSPDVDVLLKNRTGFFRFLKLQQVRASLLWSVFVRRFDFPDTHRLDVTDCVTQDCWCRHGVFVAFLRRDADGFADCVLVVTLEESWPIALDALSHMARLQLRPAPKKRRTTRFVASWLREGVAA